MDHVEDKKGTVSGPANHTLVRWRSWPCESCGGRATPIGFLFRCFGSSSETPEGDRNQVIDWFKKWEAARLLEWIQGCEHTRWVDMSLPRLDAGSEHLVLLDEQTSEVVKITLAMEKGGSRNGDRDLDRRRSFGHFRADAGRDGSD